MFTKYGQHLLAITLFAALISVAVVPGSARALCTIDPAGTYIEAEDFTGFEMLDPTPHGGDYFELVDETGTNGGKVLVSGDNGYADNTPGKEVKTYDVNFPTAGTYEIWMRGRGYNSSQDSMFFTVDDAEWKAWNYGGSYSSYVWTDSMQVNGPNTIYIDTAGDHTIKIAMRERASRIDGFYITSGTETPTDATVPSSVTVISPKDGCAGPAWTVEPGTLEPTCFRNYNAAPWTFTITNTGTEADPSEATITSNQAWAVVNDPTVPSLNQGASHTVTVSFNSAALLAGMHTAELTITGNANNSPKTVPINLLVKTVPATAACGEIPLYAENLINPAIMMQLDTSGSMRDQMDIGGGETMSRIAIAEDVLKEVFLDRTISWGFATWTGGRGNASDSDNAPTYYTNYRVGINQHDQAHQDALQDKADDGSPSGYTPLVPTLKGALAYFKGQRNDGHYNEPYELLSCQPRIVVIVTDGLGNTGTDNAKIDAVVDDLIAEGISVVAVGFGLSNATQLDRIVQKMQIAGEASEDDYLYHLHKEDINGVAIPFMAQNRQEFINAMNDIVNSVKAQVFHGSSPAPTTSVDNGSILLSASFDAAGWTGDVKAKQFDPFTGAYAEHYIWRASNVMPATDDINGFIYNAVGDVVETYTDASIAGDNFLCKPMGDIINSTPAIVGAPRYHYHFDSYYSFKFGDVSNRAAMAYVGANDGALHAFNLSTGIEQWRFYPDSVRDKMALAGVNPADDMCSSSYCHKFLLDGSPEPADVFVDAGTGWRTVLTTGLGEGGSAYFTLDVTYAEDFDASVDPSTHLWEFTETDDAELGLATSWPSISRMKNGAGAGWATVFGSGAAVDPLLQADKEAYLFAVNSYDMSPVWVDGSLAPTYKIKLVNGVQKDDIPSPPLVVDTHNDDYIADRIYVGNLYGNMYRVKDIGFGEEPEVELFYKSNITDHTTPITAKAEMAYASLPPGDIWLYFGTGRYQEQIDKFTTDQQAFYGLFDENASRGTPYEASGLVEMQTEIIEAYALDPDGGRTDLNGDDVIDADDLRKYRVVSCPSPDADGRCNPDAQSWRLLLAVPGMYDDWASERVITKPLVVAGVVFFVTFIPDGDVCEGNGDTWLYAVEWETGEFVIDGVFDTNENGEFDRGDPWVDPLGSPGGASLDENEGKKRVVGKLVGKGKPSQEIIIHNNILFVGTTDEEPVPEPVNLPDLRTKLRSWQKQIDD
jgi:type IV pilus assembly protein PilY1